MAGPAGEGFVQRIVALFAEGGPPSFAALQHPTEGEHVSFARRLEVGAAGGMHGYRSWQLTWL